MSAALRAGVAYTLLVFALAFVLGVVRVLFVAPRIGELAAVAIEVPITLTASWVIAPQLVRWFGVRSDRRERAAMGAAAFLLLMVLEWTLALLVFGQSVAETLAGYRTAAGILGLAGQVGFAFVPLLQAAGAPNRVTATRRIGRL
ncbi:MAG: hypothetical protein O2822_06290 [Chloroflexi bacterium]|nr:hypothetical protein [Chloroflexota bacterium]